MTDGRDTVYCPFHRRLENVLRYSEVMVLPHAPGVVTALARIDCSEAYKRIVTTEERIERFKETPVVDLPGFLGSAT